MLPTSISTRVIAAFGAVLVLGLMWLTIALIVAADLRNQNRALGQVAQLLRLEDAQDRLQRQLRLGVGDVTRLAEKGQPVDAATWAAVGETLRRFHHESAHSNRDQLMSGVLRQEFARRRAAEARFAALSVRLLFDARYDPGAIRGRMPQFLDALRDLERARAAVRMLLVQHIDAAVHRNATELYHGLLHVLVGGLALLLILLACTAWLRRRVIQPIVAIAERLRQFSSERDGDAHVPGDTRADELGDLARGIGDYREAVDQRHRAERRVEFLAHHDMLTGLPNRLLFEEQLALELARVRRTGERLAVFAIDLDEFKSINDRFGHAGGDAALRDAARLLTGCVRAHDIVARLGGDEFAIIQVSPDQPRAAEALVARIYRSCEMTAGDAVPVQMSIGVALSGVEQGGEELHNLADMAMYRAKSEGRHTARFFDDELKEEVRLRWRLSRDLDSAIERDELYLAYQPIADATTLAITGYEALLRWSHAELGELPPDQFIPLAESSGRIDAIGLWVADRAMAAARTWPATQSLALNLSAIQFRQPNLAGDLLALARRHGIAPERLEFEVTESATLLGNRRQPVIETLRTLQQQGARIVMDDFGTGYSSLSNLRDFRFDKLKVDRSFVTTMLGHAASASIVRSIAALGASLGIPVVAEGVETEAQLALLRRWSLNQVQGYLIGRPQRMLPDAPADVAAGGMSLTA